MKGTMTMRKSLWSAFLGLAASLGAAAMPVRAQDKPNRLSAMDFFRIAYAAEPEISPDGSKIVYLRQFSDIMTDRRYSNLWIINFDGTDNRPLTTGNRTDTSPRWSPDGTRIAYLSDADGRTQIYVRWMDTGQTARITDMEETPGGFSWSPDGKQIAFSALVPVAPPRVGMLPVPPPGAKWSDPPRVFDRLVYRFNGSGYLRPGYRQLFTVSAEGGAPHQVTHGDVNNVGGGGGGGGGGAPVWSRDAKYLIVSANRRPDAELEPNDTEIYEVSVADGSSRALTSRHGPDNAPALSADGQSIAYTGHDEHYQGYEVSHLYVMKRDGSGSRLVSGAFDRDVASPRWAADGNGVYFQYDDQGDTKIGFISLDGKTKVIAEHLGSGGSSYAGGGSFTIAKNGNFATTFDNPASDAGDIASGNISSSGDRVLTSLNKDLFEGKALGEVEEFWFPSSKDQRKIQGWIVKPPDFDISKKYPLILEIHGGPFANYGDRFDVIKQVWAAGGYVVLYVNPRGSTSYGAEFGNLIHHAYPGDDFYDLNSGVDAMIAKGYVDADNLFVTGGSGGGVLTCWMIDRTTRFRAAVPMYPVINWYSWTLTTDIPITGAKYWFPGPPWDNMQQYMDRSVLNHVKDVKTPTMLMTGEEDYRTPISEAEQYYAALKLLKVDALLVRVPEEPHGLQRRPSHQVDKALMPIAWFKKYEKH